MTTTATFEVTGMTCQHCVNAVTGEVTALDSVTGVDIDEAGYELAENGSQS